MKLMESDQGLDFEMRRLDLLYRQNLWGVVSVFVCSTTFVLAVYPRLSIHFILPWFTILNLSAILRFVLYRRWCAAKDFIVCPAQARRWLYSMAAMLFVSGLGWGTIGWISPGAPADQQAITTLIISAMVGGALATNASSKLCMYSMSIPALGLWALGMLLTGERYYVFMGLFVSIFLAMMILVGRNLNQFVVKALRLNAKLKESEERLRVARDSAQTLSWNWDLRSDEFLCEGSLTLFKDPEVHLRRLLQSQLEQPEDTLNLETEFLDQAGLRRYISVRGQISRRPSGRPASVAGICLDMTSQKNAETMRLERDVLHAANRSKSVFVANASHELRTPLSAIIGFAEAMLTKSELPASLRNDVRVIVRQGKYMVSLVGDLLDLSKIETNRLYIQKAWMNPVQEIQDSLSVIRPALDHKKLSVNLRYLGLIPSRIESDPTRFRQVLINLLSNAVKFTNRGAIEVNVSYSDERKRLLIRVRDSGMGMTEETCRNLFKPFVRGEVPEIQRLQGSGLGLALSRNLARLMGGDLTLVQTAQGEGSEFEFAVDPGALLKVDFVAPSLTRHVQLEFAPTADHSKVLAGRKILLVEDSEDLQDLMKFYLETGGAVVSLAENGEEGVREALGHNYDVVLMDMKMPTMDGYEATRNLRDCGYSRPIVALTANASTEDREMCYQAGCDDYLSKPVDVNLLFDVLKKRCQSPEASA